VLEAVSGLEGLVGDLRAGRVGRLSIAYFGGAGSAWIPPVVAVITREFPDLQLDLRLSDRPATDRTATDRTATELPADDRADPDLELFVGGARPEPSGPAAGRHTIVHLLDDPYVAVVPTGHPAASGPVPLAALAADPWIDNDPHAGYRRQVLLDACAVAGVSPHFRLEAPDYPTAISFVAAGVGVTLLPRLGAQRLPAGLVAVPLVDPTPVRRIWLAVRASAERNPAVIRARELFLALAQGSRARQSAAQASQAPSG
jgi:DNA-binding transcriptional LysR family regulator